MNNKGFIVIEANQFWTDDMMVTSNEGVPSMFFMDLLKAKKYRKTLEIRRWQSLLSSSEYPELKGIYDINDPLFWVIYYYTLLSYETFQEVEAKLKEKGFDLKPDMSEEGIITFINICKNLIDDFPKFYLVQEVELIED